MKPPQLNVLFSPSSLDCGEAAEAVMRALAAPSIPALNTYFAELKQDPDAGYIRLAEERFDLRDAADLQDRLASLRAVAWAMGVRTEVAIDTIIIGVYPATTDPAHCNLFLSLFPEFTRALQHDPAAWPPFCVLLARLSAAVGSECMIAGTNLLEWREVRTEDLGSEAAVRHRFGETGDTFLLGWHEKPGQERDPAFLAGWPDDGLKRISTLHGYAFAALRTRLPA